MKSLLAAQVKIHNRSSTVAGSVALDREVTNPLESAALTNEYPAAATAVDLKKALRVSAR